MKGMKRWTGSADKGERKFKGWSDTAHQIYEKWTTDIQEDDKAGKYKLWETAFVQVLEIQHTSKKHLDKPVERYKVNKTVVWEL